MAKDCKIVLNAPPKGVFIPGSEVSGILVFELDEPKIYKSIQVSLVGKAYVSWSESSGSGQNQTTRTYTSNEMYVGLSTIVWMNEQVPTQELHAGEHNFPFQFQLPDRLPSSFQGSIGWIQYYVEGRNVDHSLYVKAPITVVEVVHIDASQLQTPLHAEKQKTLCCLMCASAPITLNVELPHHGFCHGDIVPFRATLENGSSRRLRLRAQLLQEVVYTAQHKHQRTQKVVFSIPSGQLPVQPRTTGTWNPEEFVVPVDVEPTTLGSCGIITIEYVLRVSAIVPWGLDLTVDIAVTIGSVPLHSSTNAPNPVAQPQLVSPKQTSSVYPTQGVCPPSHQPLKYRPPNPGSSTVERGYLQSDPPPSYEEASVYPTQGVYPPSHQPPQFGSPKPGPPPHEDVAANLNEVVTTV